MSFPRNSWALLAAFALPLPLLFLASLAPDELWLKRVWDTGHVPLFAFWMVMAVRYLPLPRSALFIGIRALGLLGVAFAIEFIQLYTGRQFSMTDVFLDACGIAVGARLALPFPTRLPRWSQYVSDAVLVICLGYGLQEAGVAVFNRVYVTEQFPELWSPAQLLAKSRLEGTSEYAIIPDKEKGKALLQVTFGTSKYSTLELVAMERDWRNYSNLNIAVQNPEQTPLEMTCRVHDRRHYGRRAKFNDRFNRRVTLAPGWNTLTFSLQDIESAPATRRMEMNRIENVSCFTIKLAAPRQAYFREIWLSE